MRRAEWVQGSAVTAEYLYSMGGALATTVDATGKLVRGALYGGGMHLADYTAGTGSGGGKTEFHLSDEVNSLINTIDQTGAALESCAAGAFGEALNCSPSVDYTENHFADTKRDQESSLDTMGARYYSSTVGRFMSPDWADKPEPVLYSDLRDPQSLNLYLYVNNNPLSKVDKSGHDPNDLTTFMAGVANAFSSDNLLGTGRINQRTTAGQLGAAVGDFGAAIQGATQVVVGTGGNIVGGALDTTGVGALAGVPINVVSTAITVEGAGAAATGAVNLMKAGGNFSQGQKQAAKDAASGKCQNCGVETTPGEKSQKGVTPLGTQGEGDHIVPKSRGGTNVLDNLQHLCRDCNAAKGDKLPGQQ